MEKNWTEIFQVEQVEKPFQMNVEHGECDSSCLDAKELKCVCRCGGKNHGANLRKNVKPLDTFDSLTLSENPVEATFNPEQYLEELAILA